MVALFVLEGLGDEARRVPVLPAPEGNPVHLQDHLTHPQLAAVVGRPTPLVERETRENESNTVSLKQRFQSSRFYIVTATTQERILDLHLADASIKASNQNWSLIE